MITKNLKVPVMALLSVAALTFSSCLDSDDDSLIYAGIGVSISGSTIVMDDGITVTVSNLPSSLDSGTRTYVYGEIQNEGVTSEAIAAGEVDELTVSYYLAYTLTWGEPMNTITDLTDFASYDLTSSVSDFAWVSYPSNGYLDFQLTCDYYYLLTDNNTTRESIPVYYYLYVNEISVSDKTVNLVVGVDNSASSCLEEDGSLKDDYYLQEDARGVCSFDSTPLYNQLISAGFSDSDTVVFAFSLATINSDGEVELESMDVSYSSSISVSGLRRHVYAY